MSEKTPLLAGGGEGNGRCRSGVVMVLIVIAAGSLLANLLLNSTTEVEDQGDETYTPTQSKGWGWGSASQPANHGYRDC